MFKKLLATIALSCCAMQAQAALQTLSSWDSTYPQIAGAQFNAQQFNGVTVALGAHAYKNGVTLPNDGNSVFYAQPGTYAAEDRANWSFNFLVDTGNYCLSCLRVELQMDSDPSAAQNLISSGKVAVPATFGADSWNMEMNFLEALLGNFDPNANGIYDFRLSVYDTDAINQAMVSTAITVVVGQQVPEPESLALLLTSLGMLAFTRRRSIQAR